MELRQLRTFVAVAEELHFRRAAERLHLAQPSVSQQVRRLESELGVQLFLRNRRGATLTAAGEVLLVEAREVLARAERATFATRAAATGATGRLRLSLTRSLTGGIAGAIVEAFRERYPAVRVELDVGTTMRHVEQLRAGRIDIGFVRPPLDDPLLEELVLGREPLVCVVPKGHRLARQSELVRREDLRDEPLVWWPEEHGPGAWRLMMNDLYGDPPWPTVARTEPEEERIVTAVAEGHGISVIMLERSRSLSIPGAVYRRFANPEPSVGIAIAWRHDDARPTVARFRELAVELTEGRLSE